MNYYLLNLFYLSLHTYRFTKLTATYLPTILLLQGELLLLRSLQLRLRLLMLRLLLLLLHLPQLLPLQLPARNPTYSTLPTSMLLFYSYLLY